MYEWKIHICMQILYLYMYAAYDAWTCNVHTYDLSLSLSLYLSHTNTHTKAQKSVERTLSKAEEDEAAEMQRMEDRESLLERALLVSVRVRVMCLVSSS